MTDRERLIKGVEEYQAKHGASLSFLSHKLFSDGKTLKHILGGGSCNAKTLENALIEFADIKRQKLVQKAKGRPRSNPVLLPSKSRPKVNSAEAHN
jgi:hypothetical protein